MANHSSAKKRIRTTARKTVVNTAKISKIKTCVKKVDLAVSAKNKEEALKACKVAQSELAKGVSKGVLKKQTASRKISRLAAKVKAL